MFLEQPQPYLPGIPLKKPLAHFLAPLGEMFSPPKVAGLTERQEHGGPNRGLPRATES